MENTIERLVLLAKRTEISEEDLPDFLLPASAPRREPPVTLPEGEMDLAAIEKELILQALKKHNGNQTRAARYLKMSRRALGYRLEKYGLPGGQNTLKNSAG